jgi:hypothetical protein
VDKGYQGVVERLKLRRRSRVPVSPQPAAP